MAAWGTLSGAHVQQKLSMGKVDDGGAIVEAGQRVRSWPDQPAMTAADSGDVVGGAVRAGEVRATEQVLDQDAVRTAALWTAHYQSLVGLAVLLLRDVPTAEEVVQDSFVAMHANWRRLRDSGKALSYLRQCVVNRSRSVLRHRIIVDRHAPQPMPDMPSAEQGALALLERSAVVDALHALSARQREVVVLRYYAEFSEAQIASAMGISRGAVKSHTARAISAMRDVLEHLV
jgi:RNA polymerase sigma-70 factor (sigma-E family)